MAVPEITVQGSSVIGAQRQIWGTMTNDSTGGAFSTGLNYVNSVEVTPSDAQDAGGIQIQRNTATNGDVTITVTSGQYSNANWVATGYGGG